MSLAGVGVAFAVAWYLLVRDAAEPVSVDKAVASFRSDETGQAGETVAAVPEPGVYVYATEGFEKVDAFLGSRHDYPTETTITASPGGCGLVLRWDALEQRSTIWDLCPSPRGWAIREYRELHRFFGNTEHSDYRCEKGSVWWPVPGEPGAAWTRRCASKKATEVTKGTLVGLETVRVGGEAVEAVHLSLELTLAGTTRGTGTFDVWLSPESGLPLRVDSTNDNRTRTMIGDVHYEERFSLSLASLEPRR